MRFRPLPVMTLAAIAALLLLVWLGAWQWGRYQDKQRQDPAGPPATTLRVVEPLGRPLLLYSVEDGQPGWRLLQAARIEQAGAPILIDSAFIPGVQPPQRVPPAERVQAGAALTARLTRASGSRFAAQPDMENRVFYSVDIAAMSTAAGVAVQPVIAAADYLDPATGVTRPNPFATRPSLPPARHLGYALTWWGLAATLIAFYFLFHARVGRLTLR